MPSDEMPERIWAFEDYPGQGAVPRGGCWCDERSECPDGSPAYIRSDLCASGQQVRAEWLPIKTAPKDGSWFLGTSTAWNNDVVIVGWHFGAWREDAEPEGADYTLTHWMPLPSAPSAALTPAPQPSAATPTAQEAVAWRCKDYADGWILYGNKAQAELYQACTGCLMEALYAHPPQPSETVAEAAAVILKAIERAQIDMTILRKFMNGEPCAALRALKGGEA